MSQQCKFNTDENYVFPLHRDDMQTIVYLVVTAVKEIEATLYFKRQLTSSSCLYVRKRIVIFNHDIHFNLLYWKIAKTKRKINKNKNVDIYLSAHDTFLE